MRKSLAVLFGFLAIFLVLWQCQSSKIENQVYLNHSDTVQYVGMETCKQCHLEKFETFQHTGMGKSFGKADTLKSAANFGNSIINDPFLDFNYFPFWNGDQLNLKEFRLKNGDTVYTRIEQVDYIIGSGQHTNSHLQEGNGYVHQMPFTYYTQSGKLDLPPGFEDGNNTRFSRLIGLECMSCHNAMPVDFVKGSQNKFDKIPLGIDCERCHGPGEAHVSKIMRGDITDTAVAIDYSIVNPRKLEVDLQFELCQRCHLQGNAVLKEGKSFFDFKPGMQLSDVMDVYLPRYSNSDEEFIMASHVDRFKKSECFKQSADQFLCTSCHNPHISVKETNISNFNRKCESCHTSPKEECFESIEVRNLKGDNCVECHMPSSGAIDIPHVTVHDHFIRTPVEKTKTEELKIFLRLEAINNSNPTKRSTILAYLQQYERFESNAVYLDSAYQLLISSGDYGTELYREWVLYYHLKGEKQALVDLVNNRLSENILSLLKTMSYDNSDAWCAYRIGEAYLNLSSPDNALVFLERAVELAPFILEFKLKLGTAYFMSGQYESAEKAYKSALVENPKLEEALSNLGYVQILLEDYDSAEMNLEKSLELNPDYKEAKLNLATLYMTTNRMEEAMQLLLKLLETYPGDTKIRAAIQYIENTYG